MTNANTPLIAEQGADGSGSCYPLPAMHYFGSQAAANQLGGSPGVKCDPNSLVQFQCSESDPVGSIIVMDNVCIVTADYQTPATDRGKMRRHLADLADFNPFTPQVNGVQMPAPAPNTWYIPFVDTLSPLPGMRFVFAAVEIYITQQNLQARPMSFKIDWNGAADGSAAATVSVPPVKFRDNDVYLYRGENTALQLQPLEFRLLDASLPGRVVIPFVYRQYGQSLPVVHLAEALTIPTPVPAITPFPPAAAGRRGWALRVVTSAAPDALWGRVATTQSPLINELMNLYGV
jgi:hypothetical protein